MMNRYRFLLILSLLATFSPALRGQEERLRERVYVSTDREVYVAGDAVWMSAYCVDAVSGRLSTFSKTAYVEIHSPSGMVQTAKLALDGGRGAGRLTLPNTLPTGNYRLLAYTQLGASEEGFDPQTGARTLSVFNTFSTERLPDAVTVAAEPPQAAGLPQAGPLEVRTAGAASPRGTTRISVTNNGSSTIRFNLGVRHEDGIPAPQGQRIGDFVGGLKHLPAPRGFREGFHPEYEGEIIRARVSGTDEAGLREVSQKFAFISAPGSGENIYTESIGTDGQTAFYTSNIYGDHEMFLEIEGVDRERVCHLELVSPFLDLQPGDIPALTLSPSYAKALETRSFGMQLEKIFDADTLYEALPLREHLVLDRQKCIRYNLDDYTRFPVMEELFVEFIPEMRTRRVDGVQQIQVRVSDMLNNYYFPAGAALVLLDGVPVLDHAKILAYDPLLVKRIDIYPDSYLFGIRGFSGIVNFVTYKGTLPSMQFEDNVRIVDYQGCSLPLAYTCAGVGRDYPDFRQTLYWHPLLTLGPGETLEVECKTPAYGGRFEAVAEGLTEAGAAVAAHATLSVR
ncbi:MAG: hypothetical protein IJ603_07040 [Bacteroidales bacterium]|nr:hypothetical protein [Bacteroidales bacterium]MBR1578687.1 hypothetical protein [Bacteroidales bacterium]